MDGHRKQVPAAALRCVVGPIELGDNGEGARTAPFRMVARTGDPIDHWWWGRVVHDLAGMRLHKDRLPIDYVHDDREVIGYANRFDIASGDLNVSGALVPYRDNDRASEIIHKSQAGVPYEASINFGGDGIKIEEFGDGKQVEVNGRQFAGPITVIREWPLRGIAVCPYGADANTSTAFSSDQVQEVIVMSTPEQTNEEKIEEAEAVAAAVDAPATEDKPAEAAPEVAVEAGSEPAEEAPQAASALVRTGQDYLSRFGDQGGVWFAQGKAWDECVELQEQKLQERIRELESRLAAQRTGELDPVNFTPEPEHQRPRGIAGKVRIVGRNYD